MTITVLGLCGLRFDAWAKCTIRCRSIALQGGRLIVWRNCCTAHWETPRHSFCIASVHQFHRLSCIRWFFRPEFWHPLKNLSLCPTAFLSLFASLALWCWAPLIYTFWFPTPSIRLRSWKRLYCSSCNIHSRDRTGVDYQCWLQILIRLGLWLDDWIVHSMKCDPLR